MEDFDYDADELDAMIPLDSDDTDEWDDEEWDNKGAEAIFTPVTDSDYDSDYDSDDDNDYDWFDDLGGAETEYR